MALAGSSSAGSSAVSRDWERVDCSAMSAFPDDASAAAAPDRPPARARARDAARPRRLRPAALRRPRDRAEPELPAIGRFSVDDVVAEVADAQRLGVSAVLLFGIPDEKDEEGSGAWDEDGVIQRALRALRESSPGLVLLTDVCLCEYTSHGHCGVLEGEQVDNDATLELLARTAVSHAEAGADAVCPSDMMDGRVAAIRSALDEDGHGETPIVSYAAKYASRLLRPVPRGRRLDAGLRRPPRLPDGPGQRARGAARVRARRGRGRRRAAWSSRRCRTSTCCGRCASASTCPSAPTTSPASTRC